MDAMTQSGLKPHKEIDEQLPFERLLTEISTLFINLPADQIDNEIAAAQKRICELLDLDRSTLWITSEDDPGMLLLAHINQQTPVMPSIPEQLSANRFWPWITEKVLGGETIVISKMTDLPAEANRDRESFIPYGNKSCVYVPLSVGKGPVFGVLAFVVTRYERDWPKRIVQQFQLIAQVFANALARKRTELELVKSEKRLRMITNALPVLIAYVDSNQRYQFNNDAYIAWFGIRPGEAFGRSVREIVGETAYQRIVPYVERALSGEQVNYSQNVVLNDGRTVSLEGIYVPDFDEKNIVRGIYTLVIDVTERNLAQQESKRLQDELVHAGRISTMGELAGALAHEINQPLSAIVSNAQAAKRNLDAPTPDMEEIREIQKDIVNEGTRASGIINRLRAFLKKEKIELEPMDLNSVIREVLGLLDGDAVRRNIKIDLELDPLLPLVRGDRIQLQQVALNLVLNAFDSMGEQARRGRCIQIHTCLKDSQVLAAVKDNGIGLSVVDAEKIFQPFYTTKAKGLGMGLSICRSIIARHQGHIWAEKNPDEGTTFYFSLPAASA
jgi:two-component system, LuxR family, sensor kinase FixL